MNFDKKRCVKLLKEREILRKNGKNLEDFAQHELLSYMIMVEDQIFWNSRKDYVKILESFCNEKISLDQFFLGFSRLYSSNLKASRMLKKKWSDEALLDEIDITKSRGFGKIISYLHSLVDLCELDVTLEMDLKAMKENPQLLLYTISPEYLRFQIKDSILSRIQSYD